MANYPMGIWVINEDEFEEFTYTGGKVIYVVEEPNQKFSTHPAIITAGALLSPFEAIHAELDGDMMRSVAIYENYLNSQEADVYVSIIVAAAIRQIPIGIMFGRDELNMQFPKMLIDFLYKYYGLGLGIRNKIQPYIEEQFLPIDLAKLYNMNLIDYPTLMEKHPSNFPIHDMAIAKLAYEINPAVKERTHQNYVEYFEMVKSMIAENEGKFLFDPLEGV